MNTLKDTSLLRFQVPIGERWIDAASGKTITVTNPADGSIIGSVPSLSPDEVRAAITAAYEAMPAWRRRTAKERSGILYRWFQLLMENQEDLAMILTTEQGKPLAEAKGEIAYAASYIQWFAEEAKRVYGDTIQAGMANQRIIVHREPVGVCASITPWNFPAAMITRKIAPALGVGCTAIIKPASQTPLTALAVVELAQRAGIPAGVLNVVTGSAAMIGSELTASPLVRKISFTGSTEIGRTLMAQSAETIKKVSLELGGNAPFIVFDDADIDAAVEGAMVSKYRNTGQTCVCANRIFVQDTIYNQFAAKLTDRVGKLVVGDGFRQGVHQGPLIDSAALAKVEQHIADAVSKGAKVLIGGKRHALSGTFFQPTILTDVTPDMQIFGEETFGPVAPLFKFSTEEEVLSMANDTIYGLASYFYARDIGRIYRIAEGLEYGMVGINTGLISSEVAPFGGVKQSGLGREGSRYGIDDYLVMKYLCLSGIDS
jgi:succinate-semialdehyde dehydrogenase / glutarate-semialdehyde dehydrogenase